MTLLGQNRWIGRRHPWVVILDPGVLNYPAFEADIFSLKHESSIFRSVIHPVCGFSMMEQVMLRTVCPMENWLGTSKTTYRVG